MSDKLELEKRCGNIVRGVAHHSECAGDVQKWFPNKFGNFKISRFLKGFFSPGVSDPHPIRWPKGFEIGRKTRFEVLRSSQSAQGMCRNDPRTSLEKVIFWDFLKFSSFWHLVSDSGQILGFSRFWRLRGRNRPRYEHVGGPARSNRPQNPSKGCLGQLFPES